jgi:hypothetical protein
MELKQVIKLRPNISVGLSGSYAKEYSVILTTPAKTTITKVENRIAALRELSRIKKLYKLKK